MTVNVPLYNIKLISFAGIFQKHIEVELISELDSYSLIKDDCINIRNKDVKRLFYHHIMHGLCNYMLSIKGRGKVIVVYSNIVVPSKELNKYIAIEDLQQFLNTFISKIIKMLPIKILMSPATFSKIRADIRRKSGESTEYINMARSIVDKHDISKYTFEKARNFSKRYGLVFLSNDFFKQIKSKQLILS